MHTCNSQVFTDATTAIIALNSNHPLSAFAALELKRYLYLRTGALLDIEQQPDAHPQMAIRLSIAPHRFSSNEEYMLNTNGEILEVQGGSETGLLYGVYRLLEYYGIRFYLHGDVIPDKKIPFALPKVSETGSPLFSLRGLNPWGSHPHGLDQWNADDYMAHIGQLAKMRLNFIGIHCYPEQNPYAEPTVWIGRENDIKADGAVTSSYPSYYYTTELTTRWGGLTAKTTNSYTFGAAGLFPGNQHGPDVMRNMFSGPDTPSGCNELYNRTGCQFAKAFSFAKTLGVKTCLGTEAPLTIPQQVRNRLIGEGKNPDDAECIKDVYRGIFRRIVAMHPLDYYWLWTDESWTHKSNSQVMTDKVVADIHIAEMVLEEIGYPFKLATAGWVVGPYENRSLLDRKLPSHIPISSMSRRMGFDPIDVAYNSIRRPDKWAIPWAESDDFHGLSAPQFFVARIRKDVADARAYKCNGVHICHWRTEEMGPNIAAFARATWNQDAWNSTPNMILPNNPIHKPVDACSANRGLESFDFWKDWTLNMFGPDIAEDAASIFYAVDGCLPVSVKGNSPDVLVSGACCPSGTLEPDDTPWEIVRERFAFVDKFSNLRTRITSPGNLARFDFWMSFLCYARYLAELRCILARFNALAEKLEIEHDAATKRKHAKEKLLLMFSTLVQCYGNAATRLQETATTNGGLMTVVFMEQSLNWRKIALDGPQHRLEKMLGQPVPASAAPWIDYRGCPRIFIPTLRTCVYEDEALVLHVKIHAATKPSSTCLYWKPMGANVPCTGIALTHHFASNYSVILPILTNACPAIEYYIVVDFSEAISLHFPATAPDLSQTLILFKSV